MTVAANALTTLATVLDELGLASDSGAQDARLERYINAASDFVASYCDRTFHRTDSIAESGRGYGQTLLRLSRRPVVSIASVAINGTATTDYTLEDAARGLLYRSTGWPWQPARMPSLSFSVVPGTEAPDVVVTYNGGFVTPAQVAAGTFATRTLPYDLEDAVVQLVMTRWRNRGRDMRVVAESYGEGGFTFGGSAIPIEILGILDGYAEIVHA